MDERENFEVIAPRCWGMAQRVGMRIAAMAPEQREDAFAVAERALWATAKEIGMAADKIEGFIKIQMEAIRGMVTNIYVGGSPKGGHA